MIEYENLRKVNEPFVEKLQDAFAETLQSGWFILGRNVERFEREFAEYCGAAHCVGVASGRSAGVASWPQAQYWRVLRGSSCGGCR